MRRDRTVRSKAVSLSRFSDHTQTPHTRCDSSGRGIGPSQSSSYRIKRADRWPHVLDRAAARDCPQIPHWHTRVLNPGLCFERLAFNCPKTVCIFSLHASYAMDVCEPCCNTLRIRCLYFDPSRTKLCLSDLKIQFVPRSKHSLPRL